MQRLLMAGVLAAAVAWTAPVQAAPSGYVAFKEAASVGMRVVNASTWNARIAAQAAHAAAPDAVTDQLQRAAFDARYAAEYARIAAAELESSCSVGLVLIRETDALVTAARDGLQDARAAAAQAGADPAVLEGLATAQDELAIAAASLDEILAAAAARQAAGSGLVDGGVGLPAGEAEGDAVAGSQLGGVPDGAAVVEGEAVAAGQHRQR